jgi:hypothetical protein
MGQQTRAKQLLKLKGKTAVFIESKEVFFF